VYLEPYGFGVTVRGEASALRLRMDGAAEEPRAIEGLLRIDGLRVMDGLLRTDGALDRPLGALENDGEREPPDERGPE
jgi:hypothetical protein